MAADSYDDSMEFALRRLQKEMLELTVHQNALESILCGSHVVTLKKRVNTRNHISQSARSGVNIHSCFLDVQH